MPQLTGIHLRVGRNADSPNMAPLRRRSRFQNRCHSTICQAFITRGSTNYRNRDAAQVGLGRRGQEVLLPRMLFLVEKTKKQKK
jgi:hypothetical protein